MANFGASEIEIETENSEKNEEKDTGNNHVVHVMVTFHDADRKTVKERTRSGMYFNSKENENVISFRRHIVTVLGIKEQAQSLEVPDFELKMFRLQINNGRGENCTNGYAPLNKMAARAPDKKYLQMAFPPEPPVQIQNIFTGLFLMMHLQY